MRRTTPHTARRGQSNGLVGRGKPLLEGRISRKRRVGVSVANQPVLANVCRCLRSSFASFVNHASG